MFRAFVFSIWIIFVFEKRFSNANAFVISKDDADRGRYWYGVEENIVDSAAADVVVGDQPIICNVAYSNYCHLGTNIYYPRRYNDTQTSACVDYNAYAGSFNEFASRYPTVTLDTDGQAVSWSTFGDVGEGKFGRLTFPTGYFIDTAGSRQNDEKFWRYRVDVEDAVFLAYSVAVKIGFAFELEYTTLKFTSYIYGYLASAGKHRDVDFGLTVRTLTFNPRNIP